MPAIFAFYLGLTMWLNFSRFGGEAMYVYWPVILIGVAVGTLFMPAPYFYQRSRGWFLYSNWRLLLAGVYPVEFRDFFLGDMYCSLTYAMGHLELFFCLYARERAGDVQQLSFQASWFLHNHTRHLARTSVLEALLRYSRCFSSLGQLWKVRLHHPLRNGFEFVPY
jgi:hypothetical protein